MPNRVEIFIRRFRNKLSRSWISMRLFRLRKSGHAPGQKGLVIIQIDALPKKQLENAIRSGRVPFIKQLLDKQYYRLHSHYSGMPCSTASVQAELFYGVKSAVPAFSFYDYETRHVFIMFNPKNALEIEHRLEKEGTPLLKGGSAYSNIYTGGAAEPHFCISSIEIRDIFSVRHVFGFFLMTLLHFYSLIRTIILFLIEFGLAIIDFFRGLIKGQDLWKELKFVPSRVALCVLFRELILIRAKIDIARGLPVIHLNLMGYHEQSHRRGATSRFAHWTLRGIDDTIRKLWTASHRSAAREYDLWIYSDHGQIDTVPYEKEFGRSIQQAVKETFEELQFSHLKEPNPKKIGFLARAGLRRTKFFAGLFPDINNQDPDKPIITALGPTGHIYLRNSLDEQKIESFALSLLKNTHVPIVFFTKKNDPDRKMEAWTWEGHFVLPDQAEKVFDTATPYYKEMVTDFIDSCKKENAGDLIICGWNKKTSKCFTFATEHGSHGGIAPEETEGFAVLPNRTEIKEQKKGYLRPADLRNAAFELIQGTAHNVQYSAALRTQKAESRTIRVMSYNVHGCVGMDGKLSPRRVADVISQFKPDIVALQELDVGRLRSDKEDQATLIAKYLNMEHHFNAAMQVAEESFGDAILSALPVELVKKEGLEQYENFSNLEPRGALWVRIHIDNVPIQIFNTHLGLNSKERLLHARELLDEKWIGHSECKGGVILCGDFNSLPSSRVFKTIEKKLSSVQTNPNRIKHMHTWFGRFPLISLDHIFISRNFEVVNVKIGDTYIARLASDHRPIFADLKIIRNE